jgi:monooxygenase
MSQTSSTLEHTHDQAVEHFDVLIVGAGISGIGAGYHLRDQYPEK